MSKALDANERELSFVHLVDLYFPLVSKLLLGLATLNHL